MYYLLPAKPIKHKIEQREGGNVKWMFEDR